MAGSMSGAEYSRSDQSSLSMSFRRFLLQLPRSGEAGIARTTCRRRAIVICALMLGSLHRSPATSQSLVQPPESNSTVAEEPITPIPEPPAIDPLKIKLGERLFGDPRLSHDNSRSCSSCHDLRTNGASLKSQDVGIDGSSLPLNTPTIFNAALNFRFGWEGKLRTLESDAKAALENPQLMGTSISAVVEKLAADPSMRREFAAAYGGGPDPTTIPAPPTAFARP